MDLAVMAVETVAWIWLLNLLMKTALDNVLNIFKNLQLFILNFGITYEKTVLTFQS
jgi:hypothetical protein